MGKSKNEKEIQQLAAQLKEKNIIENLHSYTNDFSNAQVIKYFARYNISYTKPMILRYVRKSILPPIAKRAYSKEHIVTLASINFFKDVYSIEDVGELFGPLYKLLEKNEEEADEEKSKIDVVSIYNSLMALHEKQSENQIRNFLETVEQVRETVSHIEASDKKISDEEKEKLVDFMNVFLLKSQGVTAKKLIDLIKEKNSD